MHEQIQTQAQRGGQRTHKDDNPFNFKRQIKLWDKKKTPKNHNPPPKGGREQQQQARSMVQSASGIEILNSPMLTFANNFTGAKKEL